MTPGSIDAASPGVFESVKLQPALRVLHHPFHPRQDAFEALITSSMKPALGRGWRF